MNILIFSGSARVGNYTQHVAKLVQEVLAEYPDIKSDIVSPMSLGLDFSDEGEQAKPKYPQLTELVTSAQAYIIVAPEYNHGYSGSLKYMLDLHFAEYKHKPVGIVGVSDGPWGGTRMIEKIASVLKTMKMFSIRTDVNVTLVDKEVIDGVFQDREKWVKRIKKMLDELLEVTNILEAGKKQLAEGKR